MFTPLAERKQVLFEIDVTAGSLWIDCDPEQLEKILINLLSNAFKFTPDGGRVNLSVKEGDSTLGNAHGTAIISVCDNGSGIPKEQLPHGFERFYQADHVGCIQTLVSGWL